MLWTIHKMYCEYDQQHVDSAYFNCDLCINLCIDTIDMQQKYLVNFKEEHFGKNGKRLGVAVQIMVNVLSDGEIIVDDQKKFVELFRLSELCANSKFELLLDFGFFV